MAHAVDDIDGDGIIDENDTENTYYNVISNDMKQYFEIVFSKSVSTTSKNELLENIVALDKNQKIVYINASDRKYISLNDIWSSRVEAFKNQQEYFYIINQDEKLLVKEYEIIKYVCKEQDISNNKYNCSWLWTFSGKKFKATSNIDTDKDGVLDFDGNWNILDKEITDQLNSRYVCTLKDIENESDTYSNGDIILETVWYGCSNTQLGSFSEVKKSYFIDTDHDGIYDYLDKQINTSADQARFICTPKDIENESDTYPNWDPILETVGYQCNDSQLGEFSETKLSFFIDTDHDGINNYLDNDNSTNPENIEFICSSEDIENWQYDCTDSRLWIISEIKKSHSTDNDNDGISDYFDDDDNTSPNEVKFVCTAQDVKSWRYDCTEDQLGQLSESKKGTKINLDGASDSSWFWLEVGQSKSQSDLNLQTGNPNANSITHTKLDGFNKNWDISVTAQTWSEWIKNTLVKIAKDIKNLFFYIASIYLLVIILILLFSEKTEEWISNLKKWWLWVTIWLMVTQWAYAFVMVLFDKWVSENLAEEFAQKIIEPLIWLLEVWASFFFILVAILAFYKLVTANGNEDTVKQWKMSIVYAIIWFIVIKITRTLVNAVYWKVDCNESSLTDILKASTKQRAQCLWETNLSESTQIMVDIINWANWFIGIAVVLLIIYTGARVLLSAWDEETLKKAKSSMLYIAIWLWLLVMNYMILTFFILPETPIV